MTIARFARVALPAALLFSLAACEDPAKDAQKATVSSAAPAKTTEAAKPAGASETFAVDPATSSVGFVGGKITGSHPGKFEKMTGSITTVGGKAEGGKINFEVEVASVKTDSDKLDGHLQSPDFFDAAKFPKATFTSSAIKAGGEKGASHTVTGELDLHGVKKTITFGATIAVTADGATGTSEFTINRKDFGIVYPGKPDDLIKDDVLLKLSLKAKKK
jgi:polyisoprenoid-binding protein YceI